jgi:hypothetical protein
MDLQIQVLRKWARFGWLRKPSGFIKKIGEFHDELSF